MSRPFTLLGNAARSDARSADSADNASNASPPRAGKLITKEEATTLAQKLLAMVKDRSVGVQIEHTARTVTKVANGRVLATDDGDELAIQFDSQFGAGLPVTIGTNQLDDATLRRVVEQTQSMAPPIRPPDEPDDPDDPKYFTYNKREYLPVNLWHDSTIDAMQVARSETVPGMIEQITSAGLVGAATVGVAARATMTLYGPGLTSWSQETDAEVSVTARTPDGKASGWAGQAHRDWAKLDVGAVTRDAIDMANKSRNMVALEPGRRTAILGPAAVAQLVRHMPMMFDAYLTDVYKMTPFARMDAKLNKIGEQVFDRRLMMISDPQDPEGGYPPFFEVGGGGTPGFPVPRQNLVQGGILTDLSYGLGYNLSMGKPAADDPHSLRVAPMPGVKTATIDEMIANCKDGVYVNRFSEVDLLDLKTGMMTGVTRDGCFHVKDGKINKPVKNFRFAESPIFVFNKIEMIGTPSRTAFGYTPPSPGEWGALAAWPPIGVSTRWPRLPMIVPPMMVQDFTFSALADAV